MHERWPYVLYDAAGCSTLDERLQAARRWLRTRPVPLLVARAAGPGLRPRGRRGAPRPAAHMVLLGEPGAVRLMGLEVAACALAARAARSRRRRARTSIDALRCMRSATRRERDVLAPGLLLHLALAGAACAGRGRHRRAGRCAMPPQRPRDGAPALDARPLPVPEALRAIANRATDRQERQRYRSARTLLRALEGWFAGRRRSRRRAVGPADRPPAQRRRAAGVARQRRARRAPGADGTRAHQRAGRGGAAGPGAGLRAAARGEQRAGARRAGRRQRPGADHAPRHRDARPGRRAPRRAGAAPLARPAGARPMRPTLRSADRRACKRAGRVAQALRPAGYDAEVVYLVTLLQNLGRLVVQLPLPRRGCSRSAA